MALTNDQITALNFKDFYTQIRPYLNGDAHDAFIPIGSIISIMGNQAPLNFLICDGSTYNIADYPQLASYFAAQFGSANYFGGDGTTTFAVPDLQGEFLRGSGTNSHENQGSGGDVGDHQDATFVPNIGYERNGSTIGFWGHGDTDGPGGTGIINNDSQLAGSGTAVWASATTYSEEAPSRLSVRPTNTSVLYCIAYKNVYADMSGLAEAGDGINIDNGVVSVDEMPSSDMEEVASPMPSVMSRRFKYSTEEQVVGEWIDGKPVYQKTYEFPTVSVSNSLGMTINPENVINFFGTVVNSENQCHSLNCQHPSYQDKYGILTYLTSTAIEMRSINGYEWALSNLRSLKVTIQYTKATD